MKKLMTIELTEMDDGVTEINCDPHPSAEVLDELLETLGEMRAQMHPAGPVPLPKTGPANYVVPGPPGRAIGRHFQHGNVLVLYHQMYGWLNFQIPAGFLELLAQEFANLPNESEGSPH